MSSAKPLPGLRVVDEGAGRIDLVRATTQLVRATGSLSFGVMTYPHDGRLLTQTLTYQNDGDAAATLALTLDAVDDKRGPAPVGLFNVAPQVVVVPAHGSTEVTVTVVGSSAWNGFFSGNIVGSDGTNRVETAIDVVEEGQRFNLTLNFLDETGAPTASAFGTVDNVDDGETYGIGSASQTLRLPPGEYDAMAILSGGHDNIIFAAQPSIMLDSDKTVSVGANAKPVAVTVDNPQAALWWNSITLHAASRNHLGPSILTLSATPLYVTPTGAVTNHAFDFDYRAYLHPSTAPTTTNAIDNFIYNLVFSDSVGIPDEPDYQARTGDLAAVFEDFHNPGDAWGWRSNHGATPDDASAYLAAWKETLPSQRVSYFSTAPTWTESVQLLPNQPPYPFFGESTYGFSTYAPGQLYWHEWFSAPASPSFGTSESVYGAYRLGDQIRIYLAPFAWGEAEHVTESWRGTTTLSRQGQVIGTVAYAGYGTFKVPADAGLYTITTHGTRKVPWSALNTGLDATWTFHSAPAGDEIRHNLPLCLVHTAGLFDGQDAAVAGQPLLLALAVQRQAGAPKSPVTELGLEVSFDEGATWQTAPVLFSGDQGLALVVHPSAPGTVSLRAHALDADGNSVTQTVTDAYRTNPAQ
jgi:hypothetical protein